MSDNQSNLKIKQLLEELGLYEPGMTVNDMKTVYNTVNKSKQSASQENDFRQLMSQTDENSLNIHNLTQSSDGSCETALDGKMGSSLTVSEEQKEEQLNSMETDADSNDTDSITCTASTPVVSSKRNNTSLNNTRSNDIIDVSMVAASVYEPLELRVPHKNRTISAIFYHPTILKLSVEKRAKLIFQSNVIQIQKYKAIQRARSNILPWGDPIKPTLARQFNGDLCVDAETWVEEPEEKLTGEVESEQSKKNNCRNTEKKQPKRQVKRKNYKETDSSDDDKDFVPNINKKSKVSNGVVSRTGSRNKRNTVPKKFNLSLSTSSTSSRTDKIFDELKKLDKVTVNRQKSVQPALPDYNESSDDEIFPTVPPSTTTTIVEVHGSSTSRQENQTATTRQNNVTEAEQQNISTRAMAAKNFYGRNRRERAPQMNNNNDEERKTECPICRLPFPMSIIEHHASMCIQFEEEEPSEPVCDICKKRIPLTVDMYGHRKECINAICEQSVETPKCDTNDNKLGGGQMCSICDKYFMNSMDMNKHASECISSIKHK